MSALQSSRCQKMAEREIEAVPAWELATAALPRSQTRPALCESPDLEAVQPFSAALACPCNRDYTKMMLIELYQQWLWENKTIWQMRVLGRVTERDTNGGTFTHVRHADR